MKATSILLIAFAAGLLTSAAVGQSTEFVRRPVLHDPGSLGAPFILRMGNPDDDPQIDIAVQCLLDTRVLRFDADPTEVQPFADTTLSWEVVVPPGCPVNLSITGRGVGRAGTLDVTPLHVNSRFDLVASMLGGRGTLASAQVSVDKSTCRDRDLTIVEALIVPLIVAAIDEFDDADDAFEQIEPPRIQIEANGLYIHVVVKANVAVVPNPTVTLDMGLRFTVRDGVIEPRYRLFRPNADTILPDDFVERRFFNKADSILAAFKRGFNGAFDERVADDEQLFDLSTERFQLRAVICSIEPPPEPRLTVRLRVVPPGDPGRFNLRIDGVRRATNQTDGGSTGVREVSEGIHTVSQSAVPPTKLADYRTFISGDCGPDGRVTLSSGDVKICFMTNIAQEDQDQCREECSERHDLCRSDPASTPEICTALFGRCMDTCN